MSESTTNSDNNTTPSTNKSTEESHLDRLKRVLINFGAAGHAIGLAHVAQGMSDAHQRVRDGHLAMARKAGMEDLVGKNKGEDMNIHVGDIQQSVPKGLPTWAAVAITSGAMLLSGGVGAGLVALTSKAATGIEKIQSFNLELIPNDQGISK